MNSSRCSRSISSSIRSTSRASRPSWRASTSPVLKAIRSATSPICEMWRATASGTTGSGYFSRVTWARWRARSPIRSRSAVTRSPDTRRRRSRAEGAVLGHHHDDLVVEAPLPGVDALVVGDDGLAPSRGRRAAGRTTPGRSPCAARPVISTMPEVSEARSSSKRVMMRPSSRMRGADVARARSDARGVARSLASREPRACVRPSWWPPWPPWSSLRRRVRCSGVRSGADVGPRPRRARGPEQELAASPPFAAAGTPVAGRRRRRPGRCTAPTRRVRLGLVRGGYLAHGELRQLVAERLAGRRARRTGEETDLARAAPRPGRRGPRRGPGDARARWTARHLLLEVENRSEAMRVEDVRRDFVVNVSHELKTPVGAISVLAETLEDAADDPDRRPPLRRPDPAGVRPAAGARHRRARAVARAGGRRHPPPRRGRDGRPSSRRRSTRSGSRAEEHGIELAVPRRPGAVVVGDEELLTTAVRNLLVNAVAYSPERTRVSVSVGRRDGLVLVQVTDRGIGIPVAGAGPRLRALLPGRPRPLAPHGRHRAGPGHRQARRGQPRRRRARCGAGPARGRRSPCGCPTRRPPAARRRRPSGHAAR